MLCKQNNVDVSVLMCAHNEQMYIESAVKSVLHEKNVNLELIVVNDRSTDKTADILNEIAKEDKRLKIITRVDNLDDEIVELNYIFALDNGLGGQTEALNLGLKYCSGEYIARLDADDISLPNRFVVQLDYMKSNQCVDFLGSSALRVSSEGREFGKYHSKLLIHDEIVENLYNFRAFCPHSSWFVRSDLYRKLNGYNKNGFRAEDLDFMLRASELPNVKFAYLNEPLIALRMQSGRLSTVSIVPTEYAILAVLCSLLRKEGYSIDNTLICNIQNEVREEVKRQKLLDKFRAYQSLSNAYIAFKTGKFINAFYAVLHSIKNCPSMVFNHQTLSESKLLATKVVYEKIAQRRK